MKVRQTIINDYEAVHYKADMVTGWAYVSMSVKFLGGNPVLFPKKENETLKECYGRVRADKTYIHPNELKKYYQHTNGETILSPKHGMIYIFKDGDILETRKKDLKANNYEILEAEG